MSSAWEEAGDAWQKGYSNVPDKKVCSSHISEDAVRLFINRTGKRDSCDYCGHRKIVAKLESVVGYLAAGVDRFYTDPANFMNYDSREGGYQGNVYSISEILQDYIQIDVYDNALFDDIFNSFDDNKPWSNEYEYFDHEAEIQLEHWSFFKEVITTKCRYLFSSTDLFRSDDYGYKAYGIIKQIGSIARKLNLVRNLPAGTQFYRCRQHPGKEKITQKEQLASPPDEYAVYPNRMSPAGISMFYGASELQTALKETIDPTNKKKGMYTSGIFTTKRKLLVLDLTRCPGIPSQLEQRMWSKYYQISFFNAFVRDLTKSITRDEMSHIDYVPTQVVTEYFRYVFQKKGTRKLDGIIFPSSKDRGKSACVLFMDHEESMKDLDFLSGSLAKGKVSSLAL